MRPIDVLAIGETMALVVPSRSVGLEEAEDFRVTAGGAESNLACHLAALGRRSAWFGALGEDALGRRVLREIAGHGVDVTRVRCDAAAPTGLYVKDPGRGVQYYRRGSAASRLSPADLAGIDWTDVKILHLTGITLALSESCHSLVHAAIDAAHEAGARVSFDVNHRPALWGSADEAAAIIRETASRADIVLVGRDEAEELWGARTADAIRTLLPGVQHLVVKDSDIEAVEFSGDRRVAVPAPRIEVVEPVGAGDAFAAGWIAALLEGEAGPVEGEAELRDGEAGARERLARGHAVAARALSSTQDVPARDVAGRNVAQHGEVPA